MWARGILFGIINRKPNSKKEESKIAQEEGGCHRATSKNAIRRREDSYPSSKQGMQQKGQISQTGTNQCPA
jgi:hypothetical protein